MKIEKERQTKIGSGRQKWRVWWTEREREGGVERAEENAYGEKSNSRNPWWRHQNGKIFRVTDPLCGKFTGYRWLHLTKVSDAKLRWFFHLRLNNAWVNNHEAGDLRRHRAHYDVIVMDGSADDIHNALHSIGSTEGLNPLRSRIGHQLNWICPFTPIIDYIIYVERVSYTLMWIDPCAFMNNKRNLGADSI